MRRFLIQVAINALVVALVFPLLPGIHLTNAGPGTYLGVGLALSLLDALLRPVLLILTGQLLIWHAGILIVAINVVTFILAGFIAPADWQYDSVLWLIVDAGIVGILLTLVDALLGFDRPNLDPDDRGQAIWRLIERLPLGRRSRLIENLRIEQLYSTAWSYGLEVGIDRGSIRHVRETASRWISGRSSELDRMTTPQKACLMLQRLGPMYVKVGQIISSQGSGLPDEWREELDKLQSTVTPFPYVEARQIILEELGQPPEELFATFEQEPLAAASTAQVHRATLDDGEAVVAKVQRPNIVAKVDIDLRIMQRVARRLERGYAWARDVDLSGVVDQFAAGILRELDYRNEAYHMLRMADVLAPVPGVRVPILYRELSTSRVLTMELVWGVKVTGLGEGEGGRLDRPALARTFMRAMMKQLLIDGFFHADPHPGNLFIDPESGVITFLDLGLIGELRADQRLDLMDLIYSLQQQDAYGVARVVPRLCKQTRPLDVLAFRSDVERVLYQEWKYGEGKSFGALMDKLFASLARFGLRMDPELTLAIKAMAQAEEAATALAPGAPLFEFVTDETKALLLEQWTPDYVVDVLKSQAIRSGKEVVRRLPSLQDATLKWLDQYERGRLTVEVDTGELPRQLGVLSSTFSGGLQRLATGLILAGMVVGSAVGIAFLPSPQGGAWDFLYGAVVVAFLASLLFSAIAVITMVRTPGGQLD